MTTILVGAIIGVGVLAFPRIIVQRAGTGAPLATLLGAVPGTLAWLASVKLARRCPGQTPVEYAPRLLTRPVGWLYGVILAVFLIVITALAIREFGEVVKTAVLRNTPLEVTIIALLLTTAYFVRYDLQVFARVFEVFFPLMLVPLTLIGMLSLKNARLYYLLPVTGPGWSGVLQGAALASVGYVAYVIGSFLLPSLNRPKAAVPAGLWGMGLSLFLYMLVVTATLALFGPEELRRLVWPTFELVKTTTIPGFILERLESAFIGIWVAAVFTTVGATYFAALLVLTQLFKLGDHKVLALPLVPVLYMTAMGPKDLLTLYRVVEALGLVGVVLTQLLPLLFLGVSLLRGKGVTARAQQP